ncbi:MAG: peptidoglycan DD-metalloendopeptidase family protein [Sphingobium sp.]|nr:peptidoglycan DD-metalloendopeptidase family protein [Sphingobium sp.]MCP5399261.1 peptidoglycan DD-metalloendopeptidase family protein [Sphingomonas sp.]
MSARGWILPAGLAVAIMGAGWAAAAQQVVISGKATSLSEQQNALKDAKVQAERARRQSEDMERKAQQATQEADKLNARTAALAARIQQSEADIRAGEARIAIVNRMISAQQSRLAAQQGPVVRLTAALQSLSRRPPLLTLLQPGSLTDSIHARAALSQVLPVIRERTASLRQELERSRHLKSMAVQANAALKSSRGNLGRQRLALRKLEVQKRLAAQNLAANATLEAERATAMGEQARDISELMDELEAAGSVRQRLASLPGPMLRPEKPGQGAAPAQNAQSGARPSRPAYQLPAVGAVVTGFGEMSDSGVRSRGITIATQPSAQVVAPAKGRIAFAGPYSGFGQIVIIDHGDGWTSLITNLRHLSASVGQDVAQGMPVGVAASGNTPSITIELRRQGRPVDILAMANVGR